MINNQKIKLNKGIFCISIDTEMLWGRHDLDYQPFIERVQKERKIIERLLKLFERNQIDATWAIVGHLFLDQCKKENGVTHKDMVRPKYNWVSGDWLKNDPNTNLKIDPEWYGTDIVKLIQKNKTQEIGSHSFSHVIFGNSGCSVKCADSEIRESVKLAKQFKINFLSFVYPRNSVGYLSLLKKYGFKVYRGPDDYQFNTAGWLGKLLMLLDLVLLIPHASIPKSHDGLLEIPGNMYLLSNRGWRRYLPSFFRIWKAKLSLKKAINERKVFHLWFHPTDLADNTEEIFKSLEEITAYAKKEQDKGNLDILSMGETYNLINKKD
jgi:peptidoglycan/xylan/chitin deacetylase (PgdA/CDA1 family)